MEYFFGFGLDDCSDEVNQIDDSVFKEGILGIADHVEEFDNWKVYFEEGDSHTILFSSAFHNLTVNNVAFSDWLENLNQKTATNVIK